MKSKNFKLILFLFCIFILVSSYYFVQNKESFLIKNKKAICLLTVIPDPIWVDFLANHSSTYDIVIVCDNNQHNLSSFRKKYPKIIFFQLDESVCLKHKYFNINYLTKNNQPSAWEKSLFYFCKKVHKRYDHVWFLEDDVFVPSIDTLPTIDKKYSTYDYLCPEMIPYHENRDTWPHWHCMHSYPNFNMPPHNGAVCAIRLSRLFLEKINHFLETNPHFLFLEIFFPSLCRHYHLSFLIIKELSHIVYRKDWKFEMIRPTHLYHPVKDIQRHGEWRRGNKYLKI